MTKNFTMLQLFSILDGRLSTTIDDVYDILNHITGEELMTHHLPTAMNYIKDKNPQWFQDLTNKLNEIKGKCGNDFNNLIKHIKESHNTIHEIPQLTFEEKEGFWDYMVNNSLLKKIGTK